MYVYMIYYGVCVINLWFVMYFDLGIYCVFGNIILYIVFNCFFVFCKFFCNDYKLIFEFIKLLVKFLMLIIGIK